MATAPWFVISPTALLSTIGLLRGPDRTVPTPTEDWRTAVVDVVIPAFKEQDNITLALASLAKQTFRPRQIILIDDGTPWQVDAKKMAAYAGNTPFDRLPVQGRCLALFKGGRLVDQISG